MALMWGLAAPLPVYLSLALLGFLVYGAWVLFSRYQNHGQVAAKTQVCETTLSRVTSPHADGL